MTSPDAPDAPDRVPAVPPRSFPSVLPDAVERFYRDGATRFNGALIALSGGPDSVALLEASVARLRPLGLRIAACWVDHGIRPEAELALERAFVTELCSDLLVDLNVQAAARGAIENAARLEGGVEAAARRFRYEALERARLAACCEVTLTGHTSDDVLETMVMRFCTGSGLAGLRGIAPAQGVLGRPLLGVSKAEVLDYLRSIGRSYRVDSTNETDAYLRNKVRHGVIPALIAVFPSIRAAMATVAEKASVDEEALSSIAAGILSGRSGTGPGPGAGTGSIGAGSGPGVEAAAFDAAPLAVRIRVLYSLATDLGAERLPWRLALEAASAPARRGRIASGGGIVFLRSGDRVLAERLPRVKASDGSRPAGLDPASELADSSGFCFLASGAGEYRIGKAGTCRIYFSQSPPGLRSDAFSWPLWIRSKRPGDVMVCSGGRKSVQALLSEMGVPVSARGAVPVVEDSSGIAAVLGSAAGLRDAYRRNDDLSRGDSRAFLVLDLKGVALIDAVRR